MRNFTNNYLIYDELGMKEVHCMACDKTIKSRMEIKSNVDPNLIVREISKHSDYREIPVIIANGKLAFIMVCDGCKFVDISQEDAKNISEQIRNGLKIQLEQEGKLPDLIEAILKDRDYSVSRKAEVQEVTAALRGI